MRGEKLWAVTSALAAALRPRRVCPLTILSRRTRLREFRPGVCQLAETATAENGSAARSFTQWSTGPRRYSSPRNKKGVAMIGNSSGPDFEQETRIVFRVLAGLVAIFLLLVGLPAAIVEALNSHVWEPWFAAICCLIGGIGMAESARTGRWPFAFHGHQGNDS